MPPTFKQKRPKPFSPNPSPRAYAQANPNARFKRSAFSERPNRPPGAFSETRPSDFSEERARGRTRAHRRAKGLTTQQLKRRVGKLARNFQGQSASPGALGGTRSVLSRRVIGKPFGQLTFAQRQAILRKKLGLKRYRKLYRGRKGAVADAQRRRGNRGNRGGQFSETQRGQFDV
jgi:hypothetical protein